MVLQPTPKQPSSGQISTKDLAYLQDQLSWELLAIKKYQEYSVQCQDSDLKTLCQQNGQKHQQAYQDLLKCLGQATQGAHTH